jgi:hypothetical protein
MSNLNLFKTGGWFTFQQLEVAHGKLDQFHPWFAR